MNVSCNKCGKSQELVTQVLTCDMTGVKYEVKSPKCDLKCVNKSK